ncbi:hypothetical protein [Thermovirga sp.]|uniref:hypothetical protein n=1 Tax=Thermovirga sp. TaxID=2699834 RepID=UPI0025ECD6DA|nr:hypothetical protein [Thermovirga sp.]MBO8154592.1 hypothetical protein [Thermovirga sp.]
MVIAKKQYNVNWGQIISSVGSIKEDWIQHVFFFCLGAAMFGIGYASVPILILLGWTLYHFFKKNLKLKTFVDNDLQSRFRCIWFYYLLFLLIVFVSDIINSGDWNHRDSFLVNLFIGFFILTGSFVANKCKMGLERTIENYWKWSIFWGFLILLFVELRHRGVFFFNEGVFDNVNQLFLVVSFLGVVNWALFLERARWKSIFFLVVWIFSFVVRD